MDRNDRIKQKYYEKKPNNTKVSFTGNFDPSPYVDLIFERMDEDVEYGEVDIDDFMSNLTNNPKLEIIFGKASVLNMTQKAMVISHLTERISIARNFDPTPYVNTLLDLYTKKDFDQFKKVDSDGDDVLDFEDYFKDQNFTKEQLQLIESGFFKRQSDNATTLSKKFRPAFFISTLFFLIPPFFIPNFLQRLGWISVDAGWFTKFCIGLLSLIILFFLTRKLFGIYTEKIIKAENLLLDED